MKHTAFALAVKKHCCCGVPRVYTACCSDCCACRAALRCANALAAGRTCSVLSPTAALVNSRDLWAAILARGDGRDAQAILQASAIPDSLQARLGSMYRESDGSIDHTDMQRLPTHGLYEQTSMADATSFYRTVLVAPDTCQLFGPAAPLCHSRGYKSDAPHNRVDPALAYALRSGLEALGPPPLQYRALEEAVGCGFWFPAALAQCLLNMGECEVPLQAAAPSEFMPWTTQLSAPAAAAALFAAWHWADTAATAEPAGEGQGEHQTVAKLQLQAPPPPAVAMLCLALYSRVHEAAGRPSVDSLVPDLGLIAAAGVAQAGSWEDAADQQLCWGEGVKIIHAAERALQDSRPTSGSGKAAASAVTAGQKRLMWVPAIPAAQAALLSVLVHTEGVEAASQALLAAHEQMQAQQVGTGPAVPAAASESRKHKGHKKTASPSPPHRGAAKASAGQGAMHSLLAVSVINSFLADAVTVADAAEDEGDEGSAQAAAHAAIRAATTLCGPHLVQALLAAEAAMAAAPQTQYQPQPPVAATAAAAAGGGSAPAPDAITLILLSKLHLIAGSMQQGVALLVAALMHIMAVAAASQPQQQPQALAQQQLWATSLQSGLASLAASCAAGSLKTQSIVVQLLGGLVAGGVPGVSHAGLAQQLADVPEEVRRWRV